MINPAIAPNNTYTDRPALHPNWLIGAVQIQGWLLFHPSAWRNYLAEVSPELEVDFVLGDLQPAHWRNPGIQRLLLLTYLLWPLAVGGLTSLVLGLFGGVPTLLHVLAGISYTVAAAVAVGLGVSLVTAPTYGPVMGLFVGIGLPLCGGTIHGFIYSSTASLASSILFGLSSIRPGRSLKRSLTGFAVALLVTSAIVTLIYFIVSFAPPHGGERNVVQLPGNALLMSMAAGLVGGVVYGLVVWQRSRRWPQALLLGLLIALAIGPSYGVLLQSTREQLLYHLVAGISGGLLFGGLFVVPYLLGKFLAGIRAGAIVGSLIGGLSWLPLAPYIFPQALPSLSTLFLLSVVTLLTGLSWIGWQHLLLYPLLTGWNLFLYQRDKGRAAEPPSLLRFHSAFWDEFQFLPLPGLDAHLILVAERTPQEAQRAINYLATTRQRWAAKTAQVELYARQLDKCNDIEALGQMHRLLTTGELSGPANVLLGNFRRHSEDIRAALNHDSDYHRQRMLSSVCDDLNRLVGELNLTQNPYAKRFQPIALHWYHIILNYQAQLLQAQASNREIENPYIVGLPLSEEQQEIFVGRRELITRIQQFLRDGHRTAVLLYGQRRMGKTSLLQNLGRFLPSTIVPLFVDEQGTAYSTNYADHLYSVARQMTRSAKTYRGLDLPPLAHETLVSSPFVVFTDWLDAVEEVLERQGKSMYLLMLDEIEVLKQMIDKERFDAEDLLNLFRNLIQHRPKFKVLVAGSHTLEELQLWASYLINMEVIKIGYLTPAEALRLIEQPVPNFLLRYHPTASQRVVQLTRGHPYLTQLLCHEIVISKNKQPAEQRNLVLLQDVEEVIPNALEVGNLFFANIQKNQVGKTGVAILRFLALQGENARVSRAELTARFPNDWEQPLVHLQKRDLIEAVDDSYQFSIELIRRWFAT